jgi:hypothetical protein
VPGWLGYFKILPSGGGVVVVAKKVLTKAISTRGFEKFIRRGIMRQKRCRCLGFPELGEEKTLSRLLIPCFL